MCGMWRINNMITGELKNKIDGLWDFSVQREMVNPVDVMKQITDFSLCV